RRRQERHAIAELSGVGDAGRRPDRQGWQQRAVPDWRQPARNPDAGERASDARRQRQRAQRQQRLLLSRCQPHPAAALTALKPGSSRAGAWLEPGCSQASKDAVKRARLLWFERVLLGLGAATAAWCAAAWLETQYTQRFAMPRTSVSSITGLPGDPGASPRG